MYMHNRQDKKKWVSFSLSITVRAAKAVLEYFLISLCLNSS